MTKNKHPPVIDNGDEPLSNHSDNTTFDSILQTRMSRRQVMKGAFGAAALGMFGVALSGCNDSGNRTSADKDEVPGYVPPVLTFSALSIPRTDTVRVPAGYTATAFIPWGTPLAGNMPAFLDDGTNTGEDQEQQVGSHHDGMHYFPIDVRAGGNSSTHGLLVLNHEYVDQNVLHPNGATVVDGVRTVEDEVRKEIAAHGVSVVEIRSSASGEWEVLTSNLNRRITGATPMAIRGPVRGSGHAVTKYSPAGTMTRGTLNNCAHGYTPWGTYLTCEENWAGYFVNKDASLPREHARYGVRTTNGRYRWETVAGDAYERFDATVKGASAAEDYRNEPNTFGWIVEIDPFNPDSVPVKRTAMGRFAHEGVVFAPPVEGQPLVFYSGDDARNEYIYKFVTGANYMAGATNGTILDSGTLYAAKFNDDGMGEWLALDIDDAAFQAAAAAADVSFADQADVLVNTRLAADVAGATKMDRPEWGAVHPFSKDVYFALTNNANRTAEQVDEANPRGPNPYGHIIKWTEAGGHQTATGFTWDIFVLAGTEDDSRPLEGGALDASNIFASPDGLWIDANGVMWIQTDMSGSQQADGPFGNNQMLAAVPETGEIKRFLSGPTDCEVTGVVTTPDGKTMFVNIQHPGDRSTPGDFTSHWPSGGAARPRSATVIITRNDGGVIGL